MTVVERDGIPLEIERKYLIRYPDLKMLDRICKEHAGMQQTYLKSDYGVSRRVRKVSYAEKTEYWYNEKTRITDITRIEREHLVSEEEYHSLLKEADPDAQTIVKTRYFLYYGKYCFEIDIHPQWVDRAIMEVELEDENAKIDFPPEIEIIKEVTDDSRYTNRSLSRDGFVYDEI